MTDRSSQADLEAVYEGLDAAEAACRPEWPALLAAIAQARAAAQTRRGQADASLRGPRIVLTKLRTSITVSVAYSLVILIAAVGFEQVDDVGHVTVIFAVLVAFFWIRSLVVINRRGP